MIDSIGPFWDANETWLVLGVGLLLVAFPEAHGIILTALYLPVAALLIGLILRGVAFDFRTKARIDHKGGWNGAFFAGSLLAAFAQGFMLGAYILGFRYDLAGIAFAVLIGLSLCSGYALLGAGWMLLKTDAALAAKAARWGYRALWLTGIGIAAVSLATPLASERIYAKWFSLPNFWLLLPIPLLSALLFALAERSLRRLQQGLSTRIWLPFASTIGIFILAFIGLAYSLFPYLVIDRLTLWEAAAAPGSLMIILVGALVTLPFIAGYTIFSYKVFWGRSQPLSYK
jgi:cytochrome d ubiquinol oxidase subunit II